MRSGGSHEIESKIEKVVDDDFERQLILRQLERLRDSSDEQEQKNQIRELCAKIQRGRGSLYSQEISHNIAEFFNSGENEGKFMLPLIKCIVVAANKPESKWIIGNKDRVDIFVGLIDLIDLFNDEKSVKEGKEIINLGLLNGIDPQSAALGLLRSVPHGDENIDKFTWSILLQHLNQQKFDPIFVTMLWTTSYENVWLVLNQWKILNFFGIHLREGVSNESPENSKFPKMSGPLFGSSRKTVVDTDNILDKFLLEFGTQADLSPEDRIEANEALSILLSQPYFRNKLKQETKQ